MVSVLVLNGESRAGLAVTRSLGKKGIKVYVGGNRKLARSFFSKYCKGRFIYPNSSNGVEEVHKSLLENVKKIKPDVILPINNDTTYIISKYIKKYQKYSKITPLLDLKNFRYYYNKENIIKISKKEKILIPKTYVTKKFSELKKISNNISYPVLLKPSISSGGRGIQIIKSKEKLIERYNQSTKVKTDYSFNPKNIIIQEYLEGDVYTVYMLYHKGRLISSMVMKALRWYPSKLGVAISYKTVKNDKILEIALRLFEGRCFNGPVDVQFIVDNKDKKTKLLEINPKLWGTVEASIAAGIDIPFLLYQIVLGKNVSKVKGYKVGQEFRWILFGELAILLKSLNDMRSIRSFFNYKNVKNEIDLSDIKPHLCQIFNLIVQKNVL